MKFVPQGFGMTALLSGMRNENISMVICMLVHLMIPSWSFNLGTTTAMLCKQFLISL